jgi:hypothetical protein
MDEWVAMGCSEKFTATGCSVDDMGVTACYCRDRDYCNGGAMKLLGSLAFLTSFISLLSMVST